MLYSLHDAHLIPAPAARGELLVMDSFLVVDHHAVDFAGHLARTRRAVAGAEALYAALPAVIPRAGAFFPRIEARRTGDTVTWYLLVRLAPPRRTTTTLWLPDTPGDPRRAPTVKGPDAALLARLRAQAQAHGADDAVLRDAAGRIVEAANAALVSPDGPDLRVPPPEVPQLASITRGVLEQAWPATPQAVGFGGPLCHLPPLWALSSLHQIMEVTGIIAGGRRIRLPRRDARRARDWIWGRRVALSQY